MEILNVKIKGDSPLLMHSDRFADPLDPATKKHKALTKKRKKTDEDQAAIAKSEWMGGLYYDEETGPFMPGINVEACIFEASKLKKLGKVAKRAILVLDDKIKIDYKGPKDPEKMYSDSRFVYAKSVRVSTSKIMRYRPKFDVWEASFEVQFNPEQIDRDELIDILHDAGSLVGLGDLRPRFGRFTVEVEK